MKKWNELMEQRGTRTDMPMKPQVVAHALNKLLRDDAIVVGRLRHGHHLGGPLHPDARRHAVLRSRARWPRWRNGLPYSVGAAVAYPGRQVVAIVGDGGFTMLMGELATLVKYKLPVKVIIIKNNVLGQDQVGADGARGQSAVRRRVAADRFRGLCAGLRRRRLHRGRSGAGRGGAARGVRASRTGGGRGGGGSQRAADAGQDHHRSRRCTSPRRSRRASASRWDIIKTVVEDKVREVI